MSASQLIVLPDRPLECYCILDLVSSLFDDRRGLIENLRPLGVVHPLHALAELRERATLLLVVPGTNRDMFLNYNYKKKQQTFHLSLKSPSVSPLYVT